MPVSDRRLSCPWEKRRFIVTLRGTACSAPFGHLYGGRAVFLVGIARFQHLVEPHSVAASRHCCLGHSQHGESNSGFKAGRRLLSCTMTATVHPSAGAGHTNVGGSPSWQHQQDPVTLGFGRCCDCTFIIRPRHRGIACSVPPHPCVRSRGRPVPRGGIFWNAPLARRSPPPRWPSSVA